MDLIKELNELKTEVMAVGAANDKIKVNRHIDRVIEHLKHATKINIPECLKK